MRSCINKNLRAALLFLMIFVLTGCTVSAGNTPAGLKAENLLSGVRAKEVEERNVDAAFRVAQYQYGISLLRASAQASDNSTLMISPLSLELALAMAANGAEGETLTQLLTLFGASSLQELNEILHSCAENLGKECSAANSIWLRDGAAEPEAAFLQSAADYYNAEIYRAAFDQSTVTDINHWVREKTDGMIGELLQNIRPEDLIYLLNAVCFDAKWEVPYRDEDVMTGTFLAKNGMEEKAEFMLSTEHRYISDDHAQGFIKNYEDSRFRFVAILPERGMDVFDYLEELDGSHLRRMISEASSERVLTKLPKFTTRSTVDMVQALRSMGINAPFDNAEYPGFGGSASITGIQQKTYIDVGQEGTRAAAVTGVTAAGAAPAQQPRTVYLDRPFIYMILDGNSELPIFMGVVANVVNDCGMP